MTYHEALEYRNEHPDEVKRLEELSGMTLICCFCGLFLLGIPAFFLVEHLKDREEKIDQIIAAGKWA